MEKLVEQAMRVMLTEQGYEPLNEYENEMWDAVPFKSGEPVLVYYCGKADAAMVFDANGLHMLSETPGVSVEFVVG